MDKHAIIQQIKSGNEGALSLLYKEYRHEFIQFGSKNYQVSEDDLKDIFQNTVIVFYENVISGKLEFLTSDVKTYLFAIGKYQILNYKKNIAKRGNVQLNDAIKDTTTEIAEDMEQHEELNDLAKKVMGDLPENERKILELFYYQEKSMEEIAREMNYKNANVAKKKKSLIMKKLAEQIIKLSKGLMSVLL